MAAAGAQSIPDEKIREIREACSIVAVISDYVKLKKIGINYKGLCPFHNEKTPSFFVNENKKIFHCFGCGASGDVFTFIMKHENVAFVEAAKILARQCGIALPEKPLSVYQRQRQSERERLLQITEQAAAFYHRVFLQDPRAAAARRYLADRGIVQESIETFCIGYAPDAWDGLTCFFRAQNISLEAAHRIGLVIKKAEGRHYDRFRGRIMFPIFNVARHIIGFGGRVLGEGEPKYLNSPESLLYAKRTSLYGLHNAAAAIQKLDQVIIVEGYFDLLSLHQAGVTNVVAALGTALTEQQIRMLKRYTQNMITVFDADPAGRKAMIRSLEPMLTCAVSPRLVVLPQGEDPDSFVRANGGAAFQEKIAAAAPLLDFVMESIIAEHDLSTPRGKVLACDALMPLLALIADPLERDLYLHKTARRLDVPVQHLRRRNASAPQERSAPADAPSPTRSMADNGRNAEALILSLMVRHPDLAGIVDRMSLLDDFTDRELNAIGRALLAVYRQQHDIDLNATAAILTETGLQTRLARLVFQDDVAEQSPEKILQDCIRTLRLRKNRAERRRVTMLLKQAEASRNVSAAVSLQQQYMQLVEQEKKISRLQLDTMHG